MNTDIKTLALDLTKKHGFDLLAAPVGNGLLIQPPAVDGFAVGPLVIARWNHAKQPYSIGRAIFSDERPRPGLTVYLDEDLRPVAARNDFGNAVEDLTAAVEQLVAIVNQYYLGGDVEADVYQLEQ